MDREPNMTRLRDVLKGQHRDVVIEAVYLFGIILSQGLTAQRFGARMKVEYSPPNQGQAIERVMEMLAVLEQMEDAPVSALSPETRDSYARRLGELIPTDQSPALISEADIEATLRELRDWRESRAAV